MIHKYMIKDRQYDDIFTLAKDLQFYPKDFYRAIFQSKELLNFIKDQDQKKYQAILPLLQEQNIPQDLLLFKMTYILNPHLPLIYHGYRFTDYNEIAKRIIYFAPKIDVYLQDLITEGLLVIHAKLNNLDERDPTLFSKIEEYTHLAKTEPNIAYFRFGFYLYGTKDFYYDKKKYSDLKEFLASLMQASVLINFAQDFEQNGFLFALQIEDAKSPAIYERYRHAVNLYNEKKRRFKKEQAIQEKQRKYLNKQ